MRMFRLSLLLAALAAMLPLGAGVGAQTPPSAKALMASLARAPELAGKWEEEQTVPAGWIAGARQEARLRINGSWDPKIFREMVRPFSERYPFIKLDYQRGSNDTRVRAMLVAFAEGRILADVVTGIDSWLNDMRDRGALAYLGDLPNIANIPEPVRSAEGLWIRARLRYWCFAYNPGLIAKSEMPQRWEDVATTPKLRDGQLALWRGLGSWLLPLWHLKGPGWSADYVRTLFAELQPQRRKEGSRALVNLVSAGEFSASLAAAEFQVKDRAQRGAPVAFHCPDPVPVGTSTVGAIRGNPDPNGSRLFLNWLISMEGQLSQYAAEGAPPVHSALQRLGFMPYPEEIAGKQLVFSDPATADSDMKAMFEVLRPYWEAGASMGGD